MVVFCFNKGSFSDVEVEFLEGGLGDELPETGMWVLIDKLNCFLQVNSCELVPGLFELLCFVVSNHLIYIPDVFGVFQNLIEHDSFDLEI